MDNFNQRAHDKIPRQTIETQKKKVKLNVCQFNFNEAQKKQRLTYKRKSLPHPSNSVPRQLSVQLKKPIVQRTTSTNRFQSLQTEAKQLNQQGPQQKSIVPPIKQALSEQKLPALSKYTVELKTNQNNSFKFLLNKKQNDRLSLNKVNRHFRHLSQKNQIIRQRYQNNNQEADQGREKSVNQQAIDDKQFQNYSTQKCYFIRNLTLNSSNQMEIESKQKKSSINLLVCKLKQVEKRSKINMHLFQRKLSQSPFQLTTNKMKCQQMPKNSIKEQIMKKFSKLETNFKKRQVHLLKKDQNLGQHDLNGWNTLKHHPMDEILQF